ncbi:MAG: hypothetical protein GXY32_10180 [Ruminococcaceae bacterium]|nr:hypothetical protein [Oscillospiraceae bacterium]
MALTKEDLQAIREMMQEENADIRADIQNLNKGMKKLNETVAKIEVSHGQKLSALYDAHVDTMRNATTIKELDAKVENHSHRIFALEQAANK